MANACRSGSRAGIRLPSMTHLPSAAGVLSESRVTGQQLVYRRNEQLQTGPAVAQEQDGMELEGGATDEHAVRVHALDWRRGWCACRAAGGAAVCQG